MNRKNIIIYSILFLIILLGFCLRIFNLGENDFREDGYQVISAAASFAQEHTFQPYDWLTQKPCRDINCKPYTRAWPHTILVALSFKIFGISEWSARLLSVFFGTLLIIIIYWVSNGLLKNKYLALISAYLASISPFFINLSRYTRMYVLFLPVFLAGAYLIYQGLLGETKIKIKPKKFSKYFFNRYEK